MSRNHLELVIRKKEIETITISIRLLFISVAVSSDIVIAAVLRDNLIC